VRRAVAVPSLLAPIALLGPTGAAAKNLCGTAATLAGAAPLTVQFTSSCGTVHWDFGDGQWADGDRAEHTFAAGAWYVTANGDKVGVAMHPYGFAIRIYN
jgi:hypothetical protein